ncbi:MAG: flagellin-like protein [Clostridia bacterium]|nr:flagellin-like protein [Clostridia bacterium]
MQNLRLMGFIVKSKIQKFFSEEKGAVDIVAIIILIGIAIALALLFKDKIVGIVNGLLKDLPDTKDIYNVGE